MIDQDIIEYLLYRTTDKDVQQRFRELSILSDKVFEVEVTHGDTHIIECQFSDQTMCGIAESPTHTTIYFTTKQNRAIFYSRPNRDIQ